MKHSCQIFSAIVLLVVCAAVLAGCLVQPHTQTPTPTQTPTKIPTQIPYPTKTLINTQTHTIVTTVATSIPVYPRPPTGKLISGTLPSGGDGQLTIDNTAGGSDAVAVLTNSGMKDPLSGIFIQKGEKYTFNGIWDGGYDLYFILGDNWNPDQKKFMNHPSYQRFTEKFDFTTTSGQYTTYRVTLYGVTRGNANTNDVGEKNFPQL
jgi:hypothetical protein